MYYMVDPVFYQIMPPSSVQFTIPTAHWRIFHSTQSIAACRTKAALLLLGLLSVPRGPWHRAAFVVRNASKAHWLLGSWLICWGNCALVTLRIQGHQHCITWYKMKTPFFFLLRKCQQSYRILWFLCVYSVLEQHIFVIFCNYILQFLHTYILFTYTHTHTSMIICHLACMWFPLLGHNSTGSIWWLEFPVTTTANLLRKDFPDS